MTTTTRLTKNTINELTIQPLIVAIPNYRSFFYTFHIAEPLDIGVLNQEYIESSECIQSPFVLLTSDRFLVTSSLSFLTNVKKCVDMYVHLMKGIGLLNEVGIVHLDISWKNIIVKDGVLPLLRGFEQCTTKVTTNKMLETPIECRVIRHMIRHKLTGLSKHTAEEICGYDEVDLAFLTHYINRHNVIDSLLLNSKTWNVYSLNHLFLDYLVSASVNSASLTNNKFVTQWLELLKQTNHPPLYYIEKTIDLMVSSEILDLSMYVVSNDTL
jgi:hypothetical protein